MKPGSVEPRLAESAMFATIAPGHLTAVVALKAPGGEFEAVSTSLKVPLLETFWRVTLPICASVLLDIAHHFFIDAMTTIPAFVFLHLSDTQAGALAILNLDKPARPDRRRRVRC